MSDNSSIEWTRGDDGTAGATWNPILGCKRVSPGCDSCYAIPQARIREANPNPKIAAAFAGLAAHIDGRLDWTGRVNLLPERLTQPLRWRKPRRVFVNSLADMFHDAVPDEFIAKVFAVMAATPQHTYQILTKRHARMRSLLSSPDFLDAVQNAFDELADDHEVMRGVTLDQQAEPWPLQNVWLGVSVENQKWADIRVPALLETPAAVRFLSCEPLLGPIDLTPWIGDGHGASTESRERRLPSSRDGRTPDRSGGTDLASGCPPRGPVEEWADSATSVPAPASGARHRQIPASTGDVPGHPASCYGPSAGLETLPGSHSGRPDCQPQERGSQGQPAGQFGTDDLRATTEARAHDPAAGTTRPVRSGERDGEAVHRAGPGNLLSARVGRASDDDRGGLRRGDADDLADRAWRPTISWVITGGESGPKARPAHPDWFRQIRDQCTASGVPFFFKQWGDWAPAPWSVRIPEPAEGWGAADPGWLAEEKAKAEQQGATHNITPDGYLYQPDHKTWSLERDPTGHYPGAIRRWGKKAAGRLLDGREWNQFPQPAISPRAVA